MKRLLLFAMAALFLTACDKDVVEEYSNIEIKNVTFVLFPERDSASVDWDLGDGPDIYFQLTDFMTNEVYARSSTFFDAQLVNLPSAALTMSHNTKIKDLSRYLQIEYRDDDSNNASGTPYQVMGKIIFKPADYAPSRYSLEKTSMIELLGAGFSIKLEVEWSKK